VANGPVSESPTPDQNLSSGLTGDGGTGQWFLSMVLREIPSRRARSHDCTFVHDSSMMDASFGSAQGAAVTMSPTGLSSRSSTPQRGSSSKIWSKISRKTVFAAGPLTLFWQRMTHL